MTSAAEIVGRECPECGNAIPAVTNTKGPRVLKYCSALCRNRVQSRRGYAVESGQAVSLPGTVRIRQCRGCTEQFEVSYGPGTNNKRYYCTQACKDRADTNRRFESGARRYPQRSATYVCKICQKEFSKWEGAGSGAGAKRTKYCSQRCADVARSTQSKEQHARRDRLKERIQERNRQYGITSAEFDSMMRMQAGICPLCLKVMTMPCVDHDHATGKVRGLLCGQCNLGIGNLCDDADIMLRAIWYLTDESQILGHGRTG